VGHTPLAVTQKAFAPLLGGLSCPFTHRAAEVAGVAVSKHQRDFGHAQILFHQKLDRPLSLGSVEYLGKGCPLFHQQTLKRSGAHAHRFGNIAQAGIAGPTRAAGRAFHGLNFDERLALDQCDTLGNLTTVVGLSRNRTRLFGPDTPCLSKAAIRAI